MTFGDGDVQLTSRANLQLRAVATDPTGAVTPALVDEVARAGLLPHPSHERVRNIVCSPLTGLSGGLADLRGLTRELDEKLCAAAELAELPGPFLFALDDGRGDLDALSADLRVRAVDRESVQILVGDAAIGPVRAARPGREPDRRAGPGVPARASRANRCGTSGNCRNAGWNCSRRSQLGRPTLVRRRRQTPGARLGRLTQDDGRAVLSALVPLGSAESATGDGADPGVRAGQRTVGRHAVAWRAGPRPAVFRGRDRRAVARGGRSRADRRLAMAGRDGLHRCPSVRTRTGRDPFAGRPDRAGTPAGHMRTTCCRCISSGAPGAAAARAVLMSRCSAGRPRGDFP